MSCGEFAAIQFAGPDMEPRDPTVRVDSSLPFVVVDIEVLAITPRASEFTIQWLSRLEDVKNEANRLLKAGETELAIIQYQAATEILEHHINNQPKPHPSAAALLAILHLNQAQAYLTLRQPQMPKQSPSVFGLAIAPPTPPPQATQLRHPYTGNIGGPRGRHQSVSDPDRQHAAVVMDSPPVRPARIYAAQSRVSPDARTARPKPRQARTCRVRRSFPHVAVARVQGRFRAARCAN
ncbi:hypothetical protein BCR44DRAFT_1181502 [Catenaria anguillulae PL171]|uniref:Uncharacterized protein n=1 Tax=Catenaria anguillulae PL171 TaxID=765915 RepID=A0A1Y2HHJ3_9FUNG|nr:hypothetical protein BCR44DRAFT_1181502 [Catenaria anguillulae PL171]